MLSPREAEVRIGIEVATDNHEMKVLSPASMDDLRYEYLDYVPCHDLHYYKSFYIPPALRGFPPIS